RGDRDRTAADDETLSSAASCGPAPGQKVLLLVARIERSVAPLVSMRASEHISDPPIAHVGLPRAVDPVRGDPPCGWRERAPRARIRGGGRKTRTQVGGRTQPRRSLGQQRDAIF